MNMNSNSETSTGMLWFDNDTRVPVQQRIAKALDYYRRKYNKIPDLVLINAADMPQEISLPVKVRPSRSIRPGHFWIGYEASSGD